MPALSHRLRMLLTAIFAFALVLGASAPQRASAQIADVSSQSAYPSSPQFVEEEVPFAFIMSNGALSTSTVTYTVDFPAGASYVRVDADLCAASGSSPSARRVIVSVQISTLCQVSVIMTFSIAGSYAASETTVSAATDAEFGISHTPAVHTIVIIDPNPTDPTEPAEPPPPLFCDLSPDMAVSPQLIDLVPGGRGTVQITMRNLCADAPTVPGDLLISFSDGLTVVDATNGVTRDGQRAMLSAFRLEPDETRSWTVTVEAAASLAAAPVHITEHYVGGRVMSRIDGVFITPAPAPASAAVVETEPVVVESAPAVPTTLPNTAGDAAGLLPQLLTALAAAGTGLALRRRS